MSDNEGMGLDDFLNHKSTDYKGGSYLKNWRKKTPPIIDTWMHTRSKIASLWQHKQPRIVEFIDKDTKEQKVMVFGGDWTCWEAEEVLQKQRHRDEESGRRIKPPTICPMCLLQEWVYEQITSGELDWTKVVFRYEAKDSEHPTIIRAGGMLGMFGKKNMSEVELQQLKKAKIDRSKVWMESQLPKLSYVFSVVDNDNLAAGVCIAVEQNLLGDKIKEVIHKAILDADEEGNPFKFPYAIRWMHRPNEQEFNKKYDAARMGKLKLTPEIKKLIVDSDPPSLTRTLARRNPIQLRAQMEEACLLKGIPWDAIFDRAVKSWEAKEGQEKDNTDFDPDELEAAPTPKKSEGKAKAKKVEESVCEECGEMVKSSSRKCSGCGAKNPDYQDENDDDLPY